MDQDTISLSYITPINVTSRVIHQLLPFTSILLLILSVAVVQGQYVQASLANQTTKSTN
jgi:hypothetical protein